nr:MAG TPA: hypothetical protein [Caudoviricetes sp.]
MTTSRQGERRSRYTYRFLRYEGQGEPPSEIKWHCSLTTRK